jgi:hypothetical protein
MLWPYLQALDQAYLVSSSVTKKYSHIILASCVDIIHRYRKSLNRMLKVCYVPTTSAVLTALVSSFLLRPLTMKQTRQPVHAVKQSIYLDVYDIIKLLYVAGATEKKLDRFLRRKK